MGKLGVVLFAACIIVAAYLLNSALDVVALPAFFAGIDVSLRIVAAILLLFCGFIVAIKLGKKTDSGYTPKQ